MCGVCDVFMCVVCMFSDCVLVLLCGNVRCVVSDGASLRLYVNKNSFSTLKQMKMLP